MTSLYTLLWYHVEFWLPPKERRPFTFIIRDFYHDHPILWTFLCCWLVYLFNHFIDTDLFSWLLVSIGILMGHLFWGRPWVVGEQEYPEYTKNGAKKKLIKKSWQSSTTHSKK